MISQEEIINKEEKISIIGLGYVGISLATSFSKIVDVIGFDIDIKKIEKYISDKDLTKEANDSALEGTTILFTTDELRLKDARFHIIAVPTPVYENNLPNLKYLIEASTILGRNLTEGSIVVYESTVYPGVTEEVCIPILEKESGLICGVDFGVGYSPERINPGDPVNRLESIIKIVSAIDEDTLDIVADVYALIVKAGIYKAENIKVAEAAKVIENVQRDINIALMNEFSIILHQMDIDTKSVFNATSTKWNFLNFKPGLVGGHCIGVDSYFLTYAAEKYGYYPQLILTGRKINEHIPKYIADKTIKMLVESGRTIKGANIVILGFSFKENSSDIRNTKVMNIINELKGYDINITIIDPLVDTEEVLETYGLSISNGKEISNADAIILAVAHEEFFKLDLMNIKSMYSKDKEPVLIDVKRIFNEKEAKLLGFNYWSL